MCRILENGRWRLLRMLTVAGLVLVACSCSKGRPTVYRVHGQITDGHGKPAVGAVVVFHPAEPQESPKPVAHIEDNGEFALTTFTKGDGAPAGQYAITVEWPGQRKSPFDPAGPDRLNGRYRDPQTSPLQFTVDAKDDNEVPPIRLK